MASCQEPLLKSEDEDDLVFDRTGLLSNKVTIKPDVCQRGHSSGKRMQYVRTVNLCLAFFALGLCFAIPTATLKDLQESVGADLADIEFIYTARYSGYVFGSVIGSDLFAQCPQSFTEVRAIVCPLTAKGLAVPMPYRTLTLGKGGILFDRYNRQFLLFLSLLATAVGIITMPFCTKVGALMACTAITGITMGFLDTGGNVWCLDLWGKKSAPFMQTLHFCFGLGAFVAPLVAEPFLSPHFGNTTGVMDLSSGNTTSKNVPHVWFPHQRVKAFSEHSISKENVLQHINSSAVGDAVYEMFPRHTYETNQNIALQSRAVEMIIRHPAKRSPSMLEEKENNRNLYTRSNITSETENSTAYAILLDYYSSNNTVISQNISEYFANSSSQEDTMMTRLIVTTLTPTTNLATSTKLKPRKPHYADGNQLKHDDKWVRTSLKQKSKNNLNKNTKQETNNITVSTKISGTSLDKFSSTGISFINNTNKLQLVNNTTQREDPKNGTDDSEFHVTDSDNIGKLSVNFSLGNTEFIFPSAKSTILYFTPVQVYNAYKIQNVKSDKTNKVIENFHLFQNNVTIVKPFIKNKGNNSLGEKPIHLIKPQHNLKNINISGNLLSDNHDEIKKPYPLKTKSSPSQFRENSLLASSFWNNASFMTPTIEIANKTELKQTSLHSAATEYSPSTSQPTELYGAETAKLIDSKLSNEKYLLGKFHEMNASQVNVSNSSSTGLSNSKVNRVITSSLDTNEITTPTGKVSHMDFLSSLFATMCQHRLGKFEIAYVILGIYIFIVASIFLICLCLNPREPRSRQEEQLDKSKNITVTFRMSVVILVSLFLCLYVGIEVAVGQLLQTFTVKQYLQLPESTGYFMTYSFWGSFALARGISIALSIKFSGLCLLFVDLIICLTTSVLLVIGANKIEALLWVGIVVLAFGMAPIFPAVIAWVEHYLSITNRIASAFILGAALGEMTIPLIIQRFIYQEPMVLMYVNIIVNILCLVTFIALWLLASHQGEKYKTKIDRTMYQLANFDDVEDGYELCFANSRWQNDYNSHILLERKLVGKTN